MSQICSFFNISENENLSVLIRPVTREEAHSKNFFVPLENVLDIVKTTGHSLKVWTPLRRLLPAFWCPKLDTGLLLIKMQTERS